MKIGMGSIFTSQLWYRECMFQHLLKNPDVAESHKLFAAFHNQESNSLVSTNTSHCCSYWFFTYNLLIRILKCLCQRQLICSNVLWRKDLKTWLINAVLKPGLAFLGRLTDERYQKLL